MLKNQSAQNTIRAVDVAYLMTTLLNQQSAQQS